MYLESYVNPASPGPPPHAPAGHPPVPPSRIGVLLLNLGTPEATDYRSMRRYLSEFLWDRRVIEPPPARWLWWLILNSIILSKRPFSSGEAYRKIWNHDLDESPLRTITRAQTKALDEKLRHMGHDCLTVDYAMRYGVPTVESRLLRLQKAGCDRILAFALYPQYSAATTATAYDQLFRALMKLRWQPAIRTVGPYHDHEAYISALAASLREHLAGHPSAPDAVVASFHGLPKRYLEAGDPYHCHCQKTARLLSEAMEEGAPPVHIGFQSRFGKEEWLKPYTVDVVDELARGGARDIAVLAPGFAADCVETLEEIQEEIRDSFLEAGGEEFSYIPCLNERPDHIALLANIVEKELGGWITPARPASSPPPSQST